MAGFDIDHPAIQVGVGALFGHHPERGGQERVQAVFAVLNAVIESGYLIDPSANRISNAMVDAALLAHVNVTRRKHGVDPLRSLTDIKPPSGVSVDVYWEEERIKMRIALEAAFNRTFEAALNNRISNA